MLSCWEWETYIIYHISFYRGDDGQKSYMNIGLDLQELGIYIAVNPLPCHSDASKDFVFGSIITDSTHLCPLLNCDSAAKKDLLFILFIYSRPKAYLSRKNSNLSHI